jgi:flagellar biogenesis protein FliO
MVAGQLKRAAACARRCQVAHSDVLVVVKKEKLVIGFRHQTIKLEWF